MVVLRFHIYGRGDCMIERPLYLDKIMPFVDTPFVKILTGVRRCGKSTILKMIIKKLKEEKQVDDEQILNYRFDSMEYEDMTTKELYLELKSKILQSKKIYLFLDEIQEIEGWEKVVNTLASAFDVDIYITGSNSRMMSSEISTYLTGRYITFHIYTLSFEEYLTFKRSYTTLKDLKQEFSQYVQLGGFPATHLQDYSQDEVYTIVKDIYNSTIFYDIVRRNQVKKIDQLERVVKYTFNNVGSKYTAKSISNYFKLEKRKIDNETVYSYLEKLQKAYILHKCSRYDLQGKDILKTQEKFYLADVSLRYSVLGYTVDSVASSLENIVYLELKRRGYDVYIGKIKDKEIDFVATKQNEKIYVQVTQEIKSEKTQKREYEQLLEIKDNYPKYVVMADDFAGGNYEGIKTMNIVDFLLSKEY